MPCILWKSCITKFFFFFFKFNLCTCRLVQRGIGVIGENHDILSKKSTNRCNFDLCWSCLGDWQVFCFLFFLLFFLFKRWDKVAMGLETQHFYTAQEDKNFSLSAAIVAFCHLAYFFPFFLTALLVVSLSCMWKVTKSIIRQHRWRTVDKERWTGNGERKIKNGERGACNVERRKESQSHGTRVN